MELSAHQDSLRHWSATIASREEEQRLSYCFVQCEQKASQETLDFMQELRKHVTVGSVGGSDLSKIKEQLGSDAETAYDYLFSENGLVGHKAGELIHTQSIKKALGEEKLQKLINFVLRYVADLDIPVKRGTFIEFRNGMLNVSPIGRNCSQEERDEFEKYDAEAKVCTLHSL